MNTAVNVSREIKLSLTPKLVALVITLFAASFIYAAPISGQGTWQSTLQARDLNGDGVTDAFYDTALNITWARDANANGAMTWAAANTWASGYSIGSITNWRLPTMIDTGAPGCSPAASIAGGTDCGFSPQTRSGGITYSELAHLYYTTLGDLPACTPGLTACVTLANHGLINSGDFLNFQLGRYWIGLDFIGPPTNRAWVFTTAINGGSGAQDLYNKDLSLFALAVKDGDVGAAIPVAPTAILVLSMLAFVGMKRRARTKSYSSRIV